jgi:hypothetical protein
MRRFLFGLFVLCVLAAAALAGLYFTDTGWHRHKAVAKFQRKSEMQVKSDVNDGNDVLDEAYGKIKALMMYNFKGRPAIEQLIHDLQLAKGSWRDGNDQFTLEGRLAFDELVRELTDSIEVTNDIESDTIDLVSVTVTHGDRALASKIANKLVENYMSRVRGELDETLLDQKKFFEQEVSRYRTKVRDVESAMVRLTLRNGGLVPDDPVGLDNLLQEGERRKKSLDAAVKRLNRLRELTKDKPIGDAVILELVRLEELVDQETAAVAEAEANRDKYELLQRDFSKIRSDYLKIQRELADAQAQLRFWEEKLRVTQMALTISIGERGMRLSFVQRAPDYSVAKAQ